MTNRDPGLLEKLVEVLKVGVRIYFPQATDQDIEGAFKTAPRGPLSLVGMAKHVESELLVKYGKPPNWPEDLLKP